MGEVVVGSFLQEAYQLAFHVNLGTFRHTGDEGLRIVIVVVAEAEGLLQGLLTDGMGGEPCL